MKVFVHFLCVIFFSFCCLGETGLYAYNISKSNNQPEKKTIDSLVNQSNYYLNSDLNKSLNYALSALEVSVKGNNKSDLMHAYNQLGRVYFYVGMFENSYVNWHKAHQLAIETSIESDVSSTAFNLAALFIILEEYDKAQDFLNIVKPYYFSSTSKDFLLKQLNVINNQALIYHKTGKIEEAREHFEKGIIIIEKIEHKAHALSFLNAYASFLIEQKDHALALKILNKIGEVNNVDLYYNAQVDATLQLKYASIYFELKNEQKVKYHLNKGIALAKSINSISLLKEYSLFYHQVFKAEGNAEKALLFKESSDSLYKLEQHNESKIAIIRDEFEEQLTQFRGKIDEEALKFTRQKRLIFIFTFITLTGLLYLIFLKSKKQKLLKKLNKKNINHLEKKVESKHKEIISLELKHIQQNSMFEKIISDIKFNTSQKEIFVNDKKAIASLVKQNKSLWDEFELRFNQIDAGFYTALEAQSKQLTKNERRLCALLRLDFSTKEISNINNQSIRSVEIARTRIRKKLNLTHTNIKLNAFLKQI
ncbi:hypothetical protein [Psychroflexus salis]|uniref:Tetratricopeptide repeat-containing protein n=1 Tax=Psychroflexus salis TaxID=1526574 RepID=A0A917A158_9FLAO|nr:hypothetical protein [Psychroflexus salis]GGE22109.1 hypothetical protein GCM10010831_23960 [Psychroflexus salis]